MLDYVRKVNMALWYLKLEKKNPSPICKINSDVPDIKKSKSILYTFI